MPCTPHRTRGFHACHECKEYCGSCRLANSNPPLAVGLMLSAGRCLRPDFHIDRTRHIESKLQPTQGNLLYNPRDVTGGVPSPKHAQVDDGFYKVDTPTLLLEAVCPRACSEDLESIEPGYLRSAPLIARHAGIRDVFCSDPSCSGFYGLSCLQPRQLLPCLCCQNFLGFVLLLYVHDNHQYCHHCTSNLRKRVLLFPDQGVLGLLLPGPIYAPRCASLYPFTHRRFFRQ